MEKIKVRMYAKESKSSATEVIQWTGNNIQDIRDFFNRKPWGYAHSPQKGGFIYLDTLEGQMSALIGDYIIKSATGEFTICKSDVFETMYDLVDNFTIEFTQEELVDIICAIAVTEDSAKYIKPSTQKSLKGITDKVSNELYHKDNK
jgi:hypothetical protein